MLQRVQAGVRLCGAGQWVRGSEKQGHQGGDWGGEAGTDAMTPRCRAGQGRGSPHKAEREALRAQAGWGCTVSKGLRLAKWEQLWSVHWVTRLSQHQVKLGNPRDKGEELWSPAREQTYISSLYYLRYFPQNKAKTLNYSVEINIKF
jgi:hypothetical protein